MFAGKGHFIEMRTQVRTAEERDAALLPDVERSAGEAFREVPGLAWIADDEVKSAAQHAAYARVGTSWVVVDEADRPFGFLSAESFDDELHIWEFAVRRDRQGEGAGRALLEASFVYARRNGCAAVTLTTFRDVAWNDALYARMGFVNLAPEQIGNRLRAILAKERANGLPAERRCAMRLEL